MGEGDEGKKEEKKFRCKCSNAKGDSAATGYSKRYHR